MKLLIFSLIMLSEHAFGAKMPNHSKVIDQVSKRVIGNKLSASALATAAADRKVVDLLIERGADIEIERTIEIGRTIEIERTIEIGRIINPYYAVQQGDRDRLSLTRNATALDLDEPFDALPLLNRTLILAGLVIELDHLDSGMGQTLVTMKIKALEKAPQKKEEIWITMHLIASMDFDMYLPTASRLSAVDMRDSADEFAVKNKKSRINIRDKKTGKTVTAPVIDDKGDSSFLAVDVLLGISNLFYHTNRSDILENLNKLDWHETRELVRKVEHKSFLHLFNAGNPRLVKRLDGKIAQSVLDIIFNNYLRLDILRLFVIDSHQYHNFAPEKLARVTRLRESVAEMQAIDAMSYSQERGEAMAEKLAEVINSEYYSIPTETQLAELEYSKLGKALLQDLTPSTIYAVSRINSIPISKDNLSAAEERLARLDRLDKELQAFLSHKNLCEDC